MAHEGSFIAALGLSSRSVQAELPCAWGILVPQPGIKPKSPALGGRFLTTGPPGKSLVSISRMYVEAHVFKKLMSSGLGLAFFSARQTVPSLCQGLRD